MTPEHREAFQLVASVYPVMEPIERKMRRSDVLWSLTLAASVLVLVALSATADGSLLRAVSTGAAVGLAYGAGRTVENMRARRRAFESMRELHEQALVELACDDEAGDDG